MGASLLLWSQVVLGVIFTLAQLNHMLFKSVEGVSVMFFFCQVSFASINLWLSLSALKDSSGDKRIKKQSVAIYAMWTIFSLSHLVTSLFLKAQWNVEDTRLVMIIVVSIMVIVSLLVTIFCQIHLCVT